MEEFAFGEDADHAGVVGAEGFFRQAKVQSVALAGIGQGLAEGAVAGDAAGGGDAWQAQPSGGAERFDGERFDDGGLDAGAEVLDGGGGIQQGGIFLEEIADGRFQSGEAEVVVVGLEQRAGEGVGGGVSVGGEAIHFRASGVGETDQLGDFVEAFAGGVIEGGAEDAVLKFVADLDEEGVTAADDEGDIGDKAVEASPGRIAFDPRRVEVSFVVVNSEKRAVEGEGEGLSAFEADHECIGQAGALGGGDGVEVARTDAGRPEGGMNHRGAVTQMLAGGEFGDDTAVFRVQRHLRCHDVGEDAAIPDDGGAGFVAGGFDGQDEHGRARGLCCRLGRPSRFCRTWWRRSVWCRGRRL